jgi:hypothetical protein
VGLAEPGCDLIAGRWGLCHDDPRYPHRVSKQQEAQPVDALDRADRALARAQARRAEIITPDSATSPMDQTNTVQIPRSVVEAADPQTADPDATMVIPGTAGPAVSFGPAGQRR